MWIVCAGFDGSVRPTTTDDPLVKPLTLLGRGVTTQTMCAARRATRSRKAQYPSLLLDEPDPVNKILSLASSKYRKGSDFLRAPVAILWRDVC